MRLLRVYKFLVLMLIFGTFGLYSQTSVKNYVSSAMMTEKLTDATTLTHNVARITIDYYDGLGRQFQNVKVGASGNAFDLHTFTS